MSKIAIDIDSTLHHYWDLLARIAQERYGVELPYAEQHTWGIAALELEELRECVAESHSDENILAAEPYPGAVETVRAWHEAGHWIHVTSHRAVATHATTARWLDQIGMPFDDLHCSYDKISRCVALGIDVLVDDSPVNIERGRAAGIVCATIEHPWNARLVGEDGVVGAPDWDRLEQALEPHLSAR